MDRDLGLGRHKRSSSRMERRKMDMMFDREDRGSSRHSSGSKFKSKFNSVFDDDRRGRRSDEEIWGRMGSRRRRDDEDLRLSLKRRRWSPEPSSSRLNNDRQDFNNITKNPNRFGPWDPDAAPPPSSNMPDPFQDYRSKIEGGLFPNESFIGPQHQFQQEAVGGFGPGASVNAFPPPWAGDQSFVPDQVRPVNQSAVESAVVSSRWEKEINSSPIKMAVVSAQFPSRKLNGEEAERIQSVLLREMLTISGRGEAPQFNKFNFDAGVVFVTAANGRAASWLCDKIYAVHQEIGLELMVAPAKDLLKKTKLSVWIQQPLHREDPNQILHLLKVQNADLRTEDWCVFKRKLDPTGQCLFLNVDKHSLKALQERKLRAYLGLTQITFKILSKRDNVEG